MRTFFAALLLILAACPSRLRPQENRAPHRTFGVECSVCHTTANWREMKKEIPFDHALTGFPLDERHDGVACASCHGAIPLAKLSGTCLNCHEDRHKGEFGDACQDCHSPAGWRNPSRQIARHALSRFPLLGRHLTVECTSCHINQQVREYVNTPTECFACHARDYLSAKLLDGQAAFLTSSLNIVRNVSRSSGVSVWP